MRSMHIRVVSFLVLAVTVLLGQLWCQDAVLTGRIVDAVQTKGIYGADVIVVFNGTVLRKEVSGQEGKYEVKGLPRGKQVTVEYRKTGYAPDPRPYPVSLAQGKNVQNAELYRNIADTAYWGTWSQQRKEVVEAKGGSPEGKAQNYTKEWSNLDTSGLSPEARVVAARQLLETAPELSEFSHSEKFLVYAKTETAAVQTCTSQIEAALQGTAKLSQCDQTPPEVATDIAVTEIRNQSPPAEVKEQFLKEYRSTWGEKPANELELKMNEPKKNLNTAALAQSEVAGSLSGTDVQREIQKALANDPSLTNANINVTVSDDATDLKGTVDTPKEKQTAKRIAESYSGNRKVTDHMTVGQTGTSSPSTTSSPSPSTAQPPQSQPPQ